MAMKRKFDAVSDDAVHHNPKQLKLVPFPDSGSDNDCMMTEAEPLYSPHHHYRNFSSTSSSSSDASSSPVTPPSSYPAIELYPLSLLPEAEMSSASDFSAPDGFTPNVGLLQPQSTFKHHGAHCSTIPKLRVACAPGLNGQRTMWSFCEECGSISMVSND